MTNYSKALIYFNRIENQRPGTINNLFNCAKAIKDSGDDITAAIMIKTAYEEICEEFHDGVYV